MSKHRVECRSASCPGCGFDSEMARYKREIETLRTQLLEARHSYEEDIQCLCLEVEEKDKQIKELQRQLAEALGADIPSGPEDL
jgi:DNA repair exonuclease SbcCD ATPase subunit